MLIIMKLNNCTKELLCWKHKGRIGFSLRRCITKLLMNLPKNLKMLEDHLSQSKHNQLKHNPKLSISFRF